MTDRKEAAKLRRVRWIARVGAVVIRALASTWRIRVVNSAAVDARRARRQPVVFAFWHGELLPLLWQHRGDGTAVLISSHADGEIIARIAHAFGLTSVRGSTTRGGGRALLALVRTLESGRDIGVSPDGPRGPAHVFAPGTLVAAQRANAPVVPVAVHASRAWRLRSWDRFLIPRPFSRVTVAYGAPTFVAAATAREAAGETARFEALLAEAGELARA